VDNDVNALAAGEALFGEPRGARRRRFSLALGTGVGGALIVDGQLTMARTARAASWVTSCSCPDGLPCTCGGRGCLEQYTSGPGLLARFHALGGDPGLTHGAPLADLADRDPDSPAARAITQTGEFLGLGLVSLANVSGRSVSSSAAGWQASATGCSAPPGACLPPAPCPASATCPSCPPRSARPRPSSGQPPSWRKRLPDLSLALLPLDERPVNTRYPQMLGAIAGAAVLLPPNDIRGRQRAPADTSAIAAWLQETAKNTNGVVASAEYLLFGNLIASRTSNESAADVLPRLAALEQAAAGGSVPVYAFGLIHPRAERQRLRRGAGILARMGHALLPLFGSSA
jgi:hypothetical protein